MTAKQTSLYWREWAAARRAAIAAELPPLDRHALHTKALGKPKSSKLLTNADLDKVLAVFRSYTRPADLNPQLRQQRQPRHRLEHKIVIEQCALLDVLVAPTSVGPGGESYILQIMRDRFHTTDIKQIPHWDADPAQDKDSPLVQLRNTLSMRIHALRRAKGWTIAQMYELAGLAVTPTSVGTPEPEPIEAY